MQKGRTYDKVHTTLNISGVILEKAKRYGLCISKVLEDALIDRIQRIERMRQDAPKEKKEAMEFIDYLQTIGKTKEQAKSIFRKSYPTLSFEDMAQNVNFSLYTSEEKAILRATMEHAQQQRRKSDAG